MRPYIILLICTANILCNVAFSQTPTEKNSSKYTVSEYYKIYNHASLSDLTIRTTFTGTEADKMRKTISSKGRDLIANDYLMYYAEVYPGIIVREPLIIKSKGKNEILLIEQYSIPEFFTKDPETGAYNADLYSDIVNSVLPKSAKRLE
ncbi:MAG: hypothetical protein H7Y13_08725 [Sphingobacteriaceae bacterium]|nr:hypothetical protein [Sphingobacteriaceae bacterium]